MEIVRDSRPFAKREMIAKDEIIADNMEIVRDMRPFAKLISRNVKLSQKATFMRRPEGLLSQISYFRKSPYG